MEVCFSPKKNSMLKSSTELESVMYGAPVLPIWKENHLHTRSLGPCNSLPPVWPLFWRQIAESDFLNFANSISQDHMSDLWTGIFSVGLLNLTFHCHCFTLVNALLLVCGYNSALVTFFNFPITASLNGVESRIKGRLQKFIPLPPPAFLGGGGGAQNSQFVQRNTEISFLGFIQYFFEYMWLKIQH